MPLDQPPKVWQLIDIVRKDGKSMKLTIQEISEDRYEDAVQHMCTYFLAQEPICRYINAKNDSLFVQDMSTLWRLLLSQGISIAVFIDNPNGKQPIIVGVNILGVNVNNQKASSSCYEFKSEKCKRTMEIISNAKQKVVHKHYKVDKYLYEHGLSIHPDYRGYGLGKCMLKIRNLIGPAYGIPATVSVFTSRISQQIAVDVGFEDFLTKNFSDFVDKDEEYFSGINAIFKVMGKKL
ncbi:PREDICTED: uncharacterized protein LOC105567396 isoform X2 [Vollenhovia emeryi]|uniref:uncharacterized protein LOC105567396 isoform X2 n=1 Tax=Vollenhovia emeryi TaxID=411798 RepID=UPI0005F418BD|nr:PREDICTED: uncharacterized protein LOC105567396 isoform X2 [Vollenhovia emeryi]